MNEETKLFQSNFEKDWLKGLLRDGIVTVKFTKKDGSIREMKCTLSGDLISEQSKPSSSGSTRAKNEEVLSVFDLEKQAWRSFRYESIIEIEGRL